VLTRPPPKQRRDRLRSTVDASQIHSHAEQGTPDWAQLQGGVTSFFQDSRRKAAADIGERGSQDSNLGPPVLETGATTN
jgi:hypothetical protein